MLWRILRIGEVVSRPRQDLALQFGEGKRLLLVDGFAVRVDANARARELHGAALLALSPDEAKQHVALAIGDGQRGLVVLLRAHALFHLDQTVEGEPLHVVRLFLAARERALHATHRARLLDGVRHFEDGRIAALAECGDENLLARLRLFQRMRQHQQRMGRTALAHVRREIVTHLRRIDAALRRELLVELGKEARQDEVIDLASSNLRLLKKALDRLRNDARIALVADPALFPVIVELLALAAEVVDEVDRGRVGADQARSDVVLAHDESRTTVAELELLRRASARRATIGRCHENRLVLRSGLLEGQDQRRQARTLRARDVGRVDVFVEAECRRHDAGILAVRKRHRRRCKEQRPDTATRRQRVTAVRQRITRRLDRHRDGVLVPVRHRSLALALARDARVEPRIGGRHGLALEPEARKVGAERGDTDWVLHVVFPQ